MKNTTNEQSKTSRMRTAGVVAFSLALFGAVASVSLAGQQQSADCNTCELASVDKTGQPTLKVRWKRSVSPGASDALAPHAATEAGLDVAVAALKQSLEPLGVQVSLEKAELTPEQFEKDPLSSNRIWLNGAALESYFPNAKAGQAQDPVTGKLSRTLDFAGQSFVDIPPAFIVHAGLIAAADSTKEILGDIETVGLAPTSNSSCCSKSTTAAASGCATSTCATATKSACAIPGKTTVAKADCATSACATTATTTAAKAACATAACAKPQSKTVAAQ